MDLLVPQQWCFMVYFLPGKEEMGWHPTTFSTLYCITSKSALHGYKHSSKANKTFLHSFLLAWESVILNANSLPLHQFANVYGVIHRHKTGFPTTPTLHAALNFARDVTLAKSQLMICLSHFHMRKVGFLMVQTLKGTLSSPFSFQTQFGNIFFNCSCILSRSRQKCWTALPTQMHI